MLPTKIKKLISSLETQTEAGELEWEYDDSESTVRLEQDQFVIEIRYDFNVVEEVGQFRVKYVKTDTNKDYFFSTTENYEDYELVRRLYDSAQASGLDLGQ